MSIVPDIETLVRTVEPEPLISVEEAKAHLRVDGNDEDGYIALLIAAVGSILDGDKGRCGLPLVTQSWKKTFYPRYGLPIKIAVPNIQSITSIKYYDSANTQITVTLADWTFAIDEDCALIWPDNETLPTLYDRWDCFEVVFVAGYGDASAVPAEIRHAALLIIGDLYEKREGNALNVSPNILSAVDNLLSNRRKGWVG